MRPEDFHNFIKKFGNLVLLTEKNKYLLEITILFILCLILINWIAPQANALYFLLLLPAIVVIFIFTLIVGRILKRPEFGFIIIAALLPFERIGALSYGSVNIRLSQVFVLITLISYLGYNAINNQKEHLLGIHIKKDFTFLFIIIFALVDILSISVAPNVDRSLFVLASDLFIFFVYIFLSNLFVSKDILHKIIYVILLVSILASLFGIFQFFAGMLKLPESISGLRQGYTSSVFGFPRVQSVESEPQFWGNYLLIPLTLSASILISWLTKKKNDIGNIDKRIILISVIAFILAVINILMTYSRGAWYASLASIGIIGLFYIKRIINIKIAIVAGILLLMAVGSFLIILQKTNSPLSLTAFTDRATATQDSDRILTSNAAEQLFSSHKLLGIGVGSFGPYEASNIYQKPQELDLDIGWRIVNNEYLEITTETGILGILTFTLFLLSLIYTLIRALTVKTDVYTKSILIGFIAAFAGILVQYIGFSTLYVMQVWVLFALADGLAWNILHNKNEFVKL